MTEAYKIRNVIFSSQSALDAWCSAGKPKAIMYCTNGIRFFPQSGDPLYVPWGAIAAIEELLSEMTK